MSKETGLSKEIQAAIATLKKEAERVAKKTLGELDSIRFTTGENHSKGVGSKAVGGKTCLQVTPTGMQVVPC